MGELSKEEIDMFNEMNRVNTEMAMQQERDAPRCHMRPMTLDGAEDPWSEAWWECEYCGHTKAI